MTVTPITTPYGPVAFVQIGEALYPLNLLTDAAGNDVLGTADASPDPHTLLGRLKTMNDLLAQLVQLGGGTPGSGGSGAIAPSMDFSQSGNSQYLGG